MSESQTLILASSVLDRLRKRLRFSVLGRDEVVDLILVALLADGHVLLEDYPGSGKTTLAKALGDAIEDGGDFPAFRRIQFTPDLLPSDITGISVFDAETGKFHFRPGPLFAHIVLGDEINRTSPKVQAAMLEAMAEKQVTVDNETHALDDLFFVIATQNPRDVAGTYPLPVPQLDRFLFKIRMDDISRDAELSVLRTRQARGGEIPVDLPRVRHEDLLQARLQVEQEIFISDSIHHCLVDLARELRAHPQVVQGVSTRSLVLMVPALKASALLRGRNFVSGDDLNWLAPRVFGHRLDLAPGAPPAIEIVQSCLKKPMESLSVGTLQATD
ncbi:MAG: AAA family ATPase [Holophagaceae bacterium]|nr:AAA family ATPase [Holophagaceae bacterium]